MLALRDAGIPVDRYVAYEIDKYAVQVSEHNFPEIEHKGDVFKGDFTECEGFDAVIGGSPCFCAGTMIFTSDGMKPIEDVKIGDMVYTHKHRFRKVTAVGNKVADVYRVSSQGVPDFYVTENHPFYVRSLLRAEGCFTEPKWVAVRDLCNSDDRQDYFASPIMSEERNPFNYTRSKCQFLADHTTYDTTNVLMLPLELACSFLDGYLSSWRVRKYYVDSDGAQVVIESCGRMAYALALLIQKVTKTLPIISYIANTREYKVKFGGYVNSISTRMGCENWAPYISTEYVGKDTVYNISVDEDESYLANNRIVHNCTYWSIAQSPDRRETEAHGIGWELFQQYVRAIREAKPKWFLYENNKSMAPAIKKEISETFGFEPILVNSALVSAQKRERYYWVGVRKADGTYKRANVTLPEDRGIFLKDILDSNWQAMREKGHAVFASAGRIVGRRINESGHRDDYNTSIECVQRFEANDNPQKTNCLTTVQKDNMVAEPIRIGELPSEDGSVSTAQAKRIYSEDGKSVTLKANGGGQGAKTGLYAESAEEGANKNVYEVKNGMISVKGREYPIKLKDGKYIIRKLTVSECKRLQTVPEEYDMTVISDTQAYKCLGNG